VIKIVQYAIMALIGFGLWAGGYLVGCRDGMDKAVPVTKIRYMDREIAPKDSATGDRPVVKTIYKRTTDTVYVRIPVPVNFNPHGVISPTPIRIDGRDVTLTFWAPDSLRWIQDTYRVKERRWGAYVDIGGTHSPQGYDADARFVLRYRGLRGFVGYHAGEWGTGPLVGARLKLVGWN